MELRSVRPHTQRSFYNYLLLMGTFHLERRWHCLWHCHVPYVPVLLSSSQMFMLHIVKPINPRFFFNIIGKTFVSAFHVFIYSVCLVKLWCPSFKKTPEISGAQYFFCFMLMEVWIIVWVTWSPQSESLVTSVK